MTETQTSELVAPLSLDELREFDELLARHGANGLARRLGMRSSLIAAIAARLNVRDGTRAVYRTRLSDAKARREV